MILERNVSIEAEERMDIEYNDVPPRIIELLLL